MTTYPPVTPAIAVDVRAFNDVAIYGLAEPRSAAELYADLSYYAWVADRSPEAYHRRYVKLFSFYCADSDTQQWAMQRRVRMFGLARAERMAHQEGGAP